MVRFAEGVNGRKCWRCNVELESTDIWASDAVLEIEHCDSSFSGRFKICLCQDCSLLPHNENMERV